MTRPSPHASYREHVSSGAEAVEEDDVKLLPCPFCGGEEITVHSERQESLGAWASCRSCGLETPTETGVMTEQATKYWNTRADVKSLRAQLATKEQYLSEWKALADKLEDGHRRMIIRTGEAEAQLATARKALEAAKEALLSNAPHGLQKTVCADGVIYHLDGQTVGHALNLIRAVLNSGEQKQIEDWPYPEGNPTCAQDLK